MPRFATLLALLLLAAPFARAQEGPPLRRVVLIDGSVYVGTVADEAADPLVVVTTDGVSRTFAQAQVEAVTPLIRGRFFRTDPVRTRLFVSPTARTVGDGRVRLSVLGAPNVAVGLSDRVDVSATGYFALGDGAAVLPLLGMKGTVVQAEGVSVALGASVIVPIGANVSGAFAAFPYAVASFGDETRSVNIGVTGAFGGDGDGEFAVGQGAALSIGAETQLNNGVKLVVDGIVPVGGADEAFGEGTRVRGLILPGVRLFGNRFAFDVFGAIAVYTKIDYDYSPFSGIPREVGRTTKFFAFAPIGASVAYTF